MFFPFGSILLLRGVDTRASMDNPMGIEEFTPCVIKIISTITVVQDINSCIELIFKHVKELYEHIWCLKLVF